MCSSTHVLVMMLTVIVGLAGSLRHHQFYFSGWKLILVQGTPFQEMQEGKKNRQNRKGFINNNMQLPLLFRTIYRTQENTSHFFYCKRTFVKKIQHKIYGRRSGSACLNISFFAKGKKKDVYFHIFVFCLYLHILEIKIFIISCFTFGICERVAELDTRSAFPLLQQQRGVPGEATPAEHLALIAVAAPRTHAHDVVTGQIASSVTRKKEKKKKLTGVVFGKLPMPTRSHLCLSR